MIVLLSTDLMFAGPVRAAAAACNQPFKLTGKLVEPWTDAPPKVILLDLGSSKLSPAEIAERARSMFPEVKLLAFGAHVNEAALDAAQSAGFDQVLTKGQLSRNTKTILESML